MHLSLSPISLLLVMLGILLGLLRVVITWLGHHSHRLRLAGRHRSTTSAIVVFIVYSTGRERWHILLLWRLLYHVFTHTDELFDKELENSVFVCCFHLS